MFYYDEKGYLGCPQESGKVDGGDTSVREGLVAIYQRPNKILDLVSSDGICVRNPWQEPWNNPNNFTKDQLKLLVAGLFAIGRKDLCLKIYEAHKTRGYCQNSERDWPGSVKMKIPHAFYKDSKPDSRTHPMKFSFRKFKFEVDPADFDMSETIETKLFDHADVLLPNDWEFLKVAAGIKSPSGFGLWFHRQTIKNHANSDHNEENQMFAECFVMGTLKEYFSINTRFNERNGKYWQIDRDEPEFHEMMLRIKQQVLGA
jgi:hypothetical protein